MDAIWAELPSLGTRPTGTPTPGGTPGDQAGTLAGPETGPKRAHSGPKVPKMGHIRPKSMRKLHGRKAEAQPRACHGQRGPSTQKSQTPRELDPVGVPREGSGAVSGGLGVVSGLPPPPPPHSMSQASLRGGTKADGWGFGGTALSLSLYVQTVYGLLALS